MVEIKPKRILFITFDLSGYYDSIHNALKLEFESVDYFNLADYKNVPYKNIFQRVKSFYYKSFKNLKLKNYYKYNPIIEEISNNTYDVALMIRPDLFFDEQLNTIKKNTDFMIAYYHDSINNIPRKEGVISFFDKVYSYEKRDVKDYNLDFISNFIYLDNYEVKKVEKTKLFTIVSKDYRFSSLEKLAHNLKEKNLDYEFLVHSDKEQPNHGLINFIRDRKNNTEVLAYINQCSVIVDIHKYGIQDGLTFRVFESLYFKKKLITSNKDIKTYDFYNPNNIFVIENFDNIDIPQNFFDLPYEEIPENIFSKYHFSSWVKTVIGTF